MPSLRLKPKCFLDAHRSGRRYEFRLGGTQEGGESAGGMTFGTCSPFIHDDDAAVNGGRVQRILFDREICTLLLKRHERTLDDFSFGSDHRLSIQMNYYDCHMLGRRFGDLVRDEEILAGVQESFVRNRGRIKGPGLSSIR